MKKQHYNFQHHSIHRKNPLTISHINFYHADAPIDNFLNGHSYPKMIFTCQGSGYITIDGQHYPLNEKDLFLINSGEYICSVEPSQSGHTLDLLVIGFEDIEFITSSNNIDTFYYHYTLNIRNSDNFLKLIIRELEEEPLYYQNSCNYYINLLFIQLQRTHDIAYKIVAKEKFNRDCEKVRNYIDQHFAEDINLDVLAQYSNMNKYYLVHSFTNNYGCSPISYLNEKKIEESKLLLETTNDSIAEIASRIGFSSQSYFSQSFKKHTYMTPNEYRRSIKHNDK